MKITQASVAEYIGVGRTTFLACLRRNRSSTSLTLDNINFAIGYYNKMYNRGVELLDKDDLIYANALTNKASVVILDKEVVDSPTYYLYLISDGIYTKIGYTHNPIPIRLASVQIGNPMELSIIGWYSYKNKASTASMECLVHKHFKAKLKRGEWYTLSSEDLTTLHELISSNHPLIPKYTDCFQLSNN